MYGTYYCRPSAMSRRLRRELESQGTTVINQAQSPHGMLFDIVSIMSTMFNYQPSYCIMRTLCEARHLLAPPGLTLFHDIFRIMLRYELVRTVFSLPSTPVTAHEPQAHHQYDRIYRRSKRNSRECHEIYPDCQFSLLALALGKYMAATTTKFSSFNYM
uniref:Uncharacterized protein LOC108037843 n=1 Tax=Drosophila rhopaloa TaxID=1041015 RepID=A0A6P4E975_DRORH